MKISKTAKIELIICKDETRPHLTSAYLDTETSSLVATDGGRLVQVPVELEDGDVSGLITPDALKEARKQAGNSASSIAANGALRFANGGQMPRPQEDVVGKFPPYKGIIASDAGDTKVALNAAWLWDICQALGGTRKDAHVVLTFPKAAEGEAMLHPITVELTAPGTGKAVLMPVRY
jgi:hypothetical protein